MSQSAQQPEAPHGAWTYGAPGAPAPVRNGLGTAALVLGIIGAVTGFVPLLFWLGGLLGLLALVLGLLGRGRAKRGEATNKGAATAGAILGLIAMIVGVVIGIATVKAVDDAVDDLNKTAGNTAPKDPSKKDRDGKNAKAEVLAAGESIVYDDDLTVTVSAPEPFTPGEYAVGHTKGNKAHQVTITIENAGKKKFDSTLVTVTARAGKDGVSAEQIFDDKAGQGFDSTILPGKKATVTYAFDTPANAKNLTVEVVPDVWYDASQWDLAL
ncbi:DUF4352 domain-containing protein [Streptomyces sp. PKU-EA00015]|uniref:DUF4352 domain-containing protein n=1 Tax=Streptomyces sp. PKU-EA00015 TaxID=2748326 RepID=UPI0015A37335|nr:DUF4352 domain-containing protein [Streptomyces sp. PKU-EA00015]NWF29916.1 DUF4352 domain-containing protein [Streptomyces sp. PKU-EA00015]